MNWMSRITIFAILGAILSSAVLVGCGGGDAEETTATNTSAMNTAGGNTAAADG